MGELGEGLAAPPFCASGRRAALLPGKLGCKRVHIVRLRMLQSRQQTAGFTRLQVLSPLSKVNMHQLFDTLRAQGSLQLIGTEAGVLEEKWRRCVSCLRHRSTPQLPLSKHAVRTLYGSCTGMGMAHRRVFQTFCQILRQRSTCRYVCDRT